jgi:ferredoxin-NADP reductase
MKLTLRAKEPFEGDIISFVFSAPAEFTWKPGQYMHVTLPHENPDDRGIERWFTIAAPPHEDPRITTRIIGDHRSSFKSALAALEPGATIEADAPEGDFILGDEAASYVFIAGGIGFTPFHAILSDLDHRGTMPQITVLYGSRDNKPVFHQELAQLSAKYPQLAVHYVVEPDRINQAIINRFVPNLTAPVLYVSGPEPMTEAFETMLKGMGVAEDHLRLDFFPGYSW